MNQGFGEKDTKSDSRYNPKMFRISHNSHHLEKCRKEPPLRPQQEGLKEPNHSE